MKKLLLYIIIISVIPVFSQEIFKRTLILMGSRFDISVVSNNSKEAETYINIAVEEIKRIEKLISSWNKNSQSAEIIKNAGLNPVKVDKELFDLINRSLHISRLTDGAFDISFAFLEKIWKFDGSMKSLPKNNEINASISKVGFQNIILDKKNLTVFLKLKGMRIGFGAIGKGYAADKAKTLLISKGVTAGIINASGDMNTWGKQPNGEEWKVTITNPFNKKNGFALFPIRDSAVATSGNYEKYIILNNKKYTHIIDPRTGYPSSGITSVTVFAPKAEIADALATSVYIMGIETGLDRINQLPKIECIVIDNKGKVHKSKNIRIKGL